MLTIDQEALHAYNKVKIKKWIEDFTIEYNVFVVERIEGFSQSRYVDSIYFLCREDIILHFKKLVLPRIFL